MRATPQRQLLTVLSALVATAIVLVMLQQRASSASRATLLHPPNVPRHLPVHPNVPASAFVATAAGATTGTAGTSSRHVSAWEVPWDGIAGLARFRANLSRTHTISPFWYELSAAGRIQALWGSPQAGVVRTAREGDVHVVPTISNQFSSARVAGHLRSARSREAHASDLVQLVERNGYDGIDIDYEGLRASDRGRFTSFMQVLSRKLHARGKILAVAAVGKTGDIGMSAAATVVDWPRIGAVVDEFRIMAYDYHYAGGPPGPVAPRSWVRDVLAYAVRSMPASKVWLGVPQYGYDWPRGRSARAVTWTDAQRIAHRHNARVHWSRSAGAPTFHYTSGGVRHTVWFNDARAAEDRAKLASRVKAAGVISWAIGHDDPAWWDKADRAWHDSSRR